MFFFFAFIMISVSLLKFVVANDSEACVGTNCADALNDCNSNAQCSLALPQVSDVCNSPNQCSNFTYIKNSICGNQDLCAHQINTIANCFIDQCQANDENQEENTCFNERCSIHIDACSNNNHCAFVIQNELNLYQSTDALDYQYVEYAVCAGDHECIDLVIAAAKCFFKECNIEDCVLNNCADSLNNCTSNNPCHNALQMARSGYCDDIDCFNNDVQLTHLCNNNNECVEQFNDIALCYHQYCYDNDKKEALAKRNGNEFVSDSKKCVAESGRHAYLDEYGNCCSELGRVDCLWELEHSHCGWFYHNGEGYCYGWSSSETCGDFKKNNVNAGPVSCSFEGDCFNDYCNQLIQICQETENCGKALHEYIYHESYDANLCNGAEECVKAFGNVISCLVDNCQAIIRESNTTTASFDSYEEFLTTNIPETTEDSMVEQEKKSFVKAESIAL